MWQLLVLFSHLVSRLLPPWTPTSQLVPVPKNRRRLSEAEMVLFRDQLAEAEEARRGSTSASGWVALWLARMAAWFSGETTLSRKRRNGPRSTPPGTRS